MTVLVFLGTFLLLFFGVFWKIPPPDEQLYVTFSEDSFRLSVKANQTELRCEGLFLAV